MKAVVNTPSVNATPAADANASAASSIRTSALQPESITPYLVMLVGAFAFAAMGHFTHALHNDVPWQYVALFRNVCVLVLTLALALAAGVKLHFFEPRALWVRSLAGSVSVLCNFYAFSQLPVSEVLTLTNMYPVWVAILSWPLLHEKPTLAVWFSAISAVVGVTLIQQPHLASGNHAIWIALLSSFTTATAMFGMHRLSNIDARAVVVHFSIVSLASCAVATLISAPSLAASPTWTVSTWGYLLGVGVSSTVGQLFMTIAFSSGKPAKVAVVGLTQVAFAVLFDMLLWNRGLPFTTMSGMAFIITPTVWLILHRRLPKRRVEPTEDVLELDDEEEGPPGTGAAPASCIRLTGDVLRTTK